MTKKKDQYGNVTTSPALFQCTIKHIEPMLDGTKIIPLDGLTQGSVVDV